MNLSSAIKRHEDLAASAARDGKARPARYHLQRAGELKNAKQLRKELASR